MLQKIVTGLDPDLFQSQVVSLTDKGLVGREIEASGVPVRALHAAGYRGMAACLPDLVAEVRRAGPHLIQGWMYHGNLAATTARLLARSQAPVLWNVRHSLENLKNEKRLTAAAILSGAPLSRTAVKIVYNSAASARRHEAIGYARGKTKIIPNGFDLDRFKPSEELRLEVRGALGVKDDELLVGMAARYCRIKAPADFLKAAAICSQRLPKVRFLLAGTGMDDSNRELTNIVHGLGLNGAVIMLGERSDIHRLLPALDLHALSSLAESFPNIMGEAMACGVPCLATDVGECARIIGDTGKIVPAKRPDLLAEALIQLLPQAPRMRGEQGLRARKRVEGLFSLEAVIREYQTLYRSITLKHPMGKGVGWGSSLL